MTYRFHFDDGGPTMDAAPDDWIYRPGDPHGDLWAQARKCTLANRIRPGQSIEDDGLFGPVRVVERVEIVEENTKRK
jgi:hypothetical protein